MNQTDNIAELATALIEAKKKFTKALKNASNPAFKSKYADLASAIEATEAALSECGLAVMQFAGCQPAEECVSVTTRILHKSGQYIENVLDMPARGRQGFDAQSVGSAITYARRYALMAMVGIAPEDDDGNAASGANNGTAKEIVRKSEKPQVGVTASGEPIFDEDGTPVVVRPPVTQMQAPRQYGGAQVGIPRGKRFFAIAMQAGHTKDEVNNYLGALGCEKSEEIPVSKYEEACGWAASIA